MDTVETIAEVRKCVAAARSAGRSVGLVPTMGALHAGHRSLVESARGRCDFVVVSIFVNPTQFGPNEDLDTYPRPLEADLATCREDGVDLVFCPSVDEIYAPHGRTMVHVAKLTDGLCGAHRPGHFDGVTTVVAKLLNIVQPDQVFFGEKDYQQLKVIERMATDLDMPIEIVACPTIREADGLAMSSRNAYLAPAQRKQAAVLIRAMRRAAEAAKTGTTDTAVLIEGIEHDLRESGPCNIDYVQIVDCDTLEPLGGLQGPARICLAVRIGQTRLIDNLAVDAPRAER